MIEYSKYTLTPIKQLNNFSNLDTRHGVFLRFHGQYYLDYHPWKEFGDISVDELLKQLENDQIPDFILGLINLEKSRALIEHKSFHNHGITQKKVKLKVLGTLPELAGQITDLNPDKKYRLDFNNRFKETEILEFWSHLSPSSKSKVDYLEDPCPNLNNSWKILTEAKIPLACDRNDKTSAYYHFEIFKPNIEIYTDHQRPIIFSSYMGHDLGRYHAYLSMCQLADMNEYHGIDTPGIYEEQLPLFSKQGDRTIIDQSRITQMYQELEEREWNSL